ncbi:MAG TPA: putative lipid II flippase FtsW [Actinomycetota bacterium]|nr:putative lipid II flippase FtsW [Actinomycetota bacterium]
MSSRIVRSWNPATLLAVTTGVLLTLGLVMILSASSVSSFATYGSSFLFFKKQLLWAALGLVGYITFSRWDYRRLRGIGYVLMGVTIVLLIAVLIPGVGVMVGGSSRWLRIGALSFQPSELAKLSLLMFAADVFARRDDRTFGDLPRTLLPMIPALGVLTLLVMMQPDLGTTLLLACIGMTMLFIAGAPMRHLVPMGGLAVATAAVAAYAAPYRRERLLAFIDPWSDPLDTGYQTIQSLIALGSGGWFGVGLGASRQKWSYVPNAHTDFIYAILGEETGLLGTLMVWGMFALIAFIGVTAARRAPDRYGMLLASGITVWISVQAIVNVGAVTASLPITGVPLPLVSFGGSSLVISLIAMGILTNIAASSHKRRNKAPTTAS